MSLNEPLGPRHGEVKRLRELLRDRKARAAAAVCVLEGPRVVEGALDRGIDLETVFLGYGAAPAFGPLVERMRATGAPVLELKEGVLERVGTTVTPQPVLAVARITPTRLEELPGDGLVLVVVQVRDPGNAGTLLRTAEAAGAAAIVFCDDSVDPYHPKVVRASAGAIFGIPVVEVDDPVQVLDALGAQGRRRFGTVASGGTPYDAVDLTGPVAVVLGNEARGLPQTVTAGLDEGITIPMRGGESLNVAMAAAVICFEADRQRRRP